MQKTPKCFIIIMIDEKDGLFPWARRVALKELVAGFSPLTTKTTAKGRWTGKIPIWT
ncbi:MAG TPA: hypothetical protein VIT00_06425 [Terrimicrobiaceae bacterium]